MQTQTQTYTGLTAADAVSVMHLKNAWEEKRSPDLRKLKQSPALNTLRLQVLMSLCLTAVHTKDEDMMRHCLGAVLAPYFSPLSPNPPPRWCFKIFCHKVTASVKWVGTLSAKRYLLAFRNQHKDWFLLSPLCLEAFLHAFVAQAVDPEVWQPILTQTGVDANASEWFATALGARCRVGGYDEFLTCVETKKSLLQSVSLAQQCLQLAVEHGHLAIAQFLIKVVGSSASYTLIERVHDAAMLDWCLAQDDAVLRIHPFTVFRTGIQRGKVIGTDRSPESDWVWLVQHHFPWKEPEVVAMPTVDHLFSCSGRTRVTDVASLQTMMDLIAIWGRVDLGEWLVTHATTASVVHELGDPMRVKVFLGFACRGNKMGVIQWFLTRVVPHQTVSTASWFWAAVQCFNTVSRQYKALKPYHDLIHWVLENLEASVTAGDTHIALMDRWTFQDLAQQNHFEYIHVIRDFLAVKTLYRIYSLPLFQAVPEKLETVMEELRWCGGLRANWVSLVIRTGQRKIRPHTSDFSI